MKRKDDNIDLFKNGRKEYVCPITSLPILELEPFSSIKISDKWTVSLRKIGNPHITHY